MATGGPSGHNDDFRRTWDKSTYERMALDRLKKERDKKVESKKPVKKELLQRRDYKVDLDGHLGKSVVIAKNTPQDQSGGYYCNVCDCLVKDSINFLDHINGRKHQKNMGMSMKIERSTVDQVKKRFQTNKQKKQEDKKQYDFELRMKELKEEEEKMKEYRREKRKERKRRARGEPTLVEEEEEEEEEQVDPELAAIMGFTGFGAAKKSKS